MRIGKLAFKLRLSRTSISGLALLLVGIILFMIAYNSQSELDIIGETTDPLLQQRVASLTAVRDATVIAAIGFFFLGLFAVFVLTERSLSSALSENQMLGTARATNEIISALSLQGNSVYLPAMHGSTKERVFIPAPRNRTVLPSALSDDLYLSPGKDGSSPGILVEPLGLSLLNDIERELDISLAGVGIEAAEGSLQILKFGLGIMKDFHFKERDGRTILRVEYSALRNACRSVRKEKPDTCRQASCVGCSCLLTALARAIGKAVMIEKVDNSTDRVEFTLSLADW